MFLRGKSVYSVMGSFGCLQNLLLSKVLCEIIGNREGLSFSKAWICVWKLLELALEACRGESKLRDISHTRLVVG